MKNNGISLKNYIINKQLTKAISEYKDFSNHPHVQVAQRLKNTGKSDADLVGSTIHYVICVQPTCAPEKTNPSLADKAYHPDEYLAKKGQLDLDIQWYITQQVLPPITRLIDNIEGIEVEFVAQCLGVDSKKFKYYSDKKENDPIHENNGAPIQSAILQNETLQKLI